ncbi:hypothetical protein [Actinoplanes sp. NPDC026670]|uniref:hypothetical protein n=1 Tax=Actinoplanes sp. NPDC026670 TaxID=3154700 RepID=UPI0033C2768A
MAAETTVKAAPPTVETTFAGCGHTASLPQTSSVPACPNGCDGTPDHRRFVPRPRTR